MDVARATEIVVIMLSPTLAVAGTLTLIRVSRGVSGMLRERRSSAHLRPTGQPIEQIAADLRRLLREHEATRSAPGMARRAQHLLALERAIADCAVDAARALGLAGYQPGAADAPAGRNLTTRQLRRLLLAIADAGLVLPASVGLLAADRRL